MAARRPGAPDRGSRSAPGAPTSVDVVPAARYAFLDGPDPPGDGPPGRGDRAPREHDAGLPGLRGPGLPLPGDRRAGDRRRRPGRLPRPHAWSASPTAPAGWTHLPWAEVSEARIGGREPILRLEDLLGAWPDVRFNLDIKAAGVLAPLVRTVRRMKVADRICLGSFSDARIAAARRLFGPARVHVARPPRGRRAAAVLLLAEGGRAGPHPGRLRAGAAAARRPGARRRALPRRRARPGPPGPRLDRRRPRRRPRACSTSASTAS